MKKFFIVLAFMAMSISANAFEFDGIDLNTSYAKITQEIAKRGYTYNHELNCLEGNCHGAHIFLSINYIDVKEAGMLGQLIVNIPAKRSSPAMFGDTVSIFDVIYHRVSKEGEAPVYQVDNDGTQLMLGQKEGFITLTYNTPYYAPAKTKKK